MTHAIAHTEAARQPRPLVDILGERLPGQRGSVSGAALLHAHTVLLADPNHTRRSSLAAELHGAGLHRVVEANSVGAVDNVIDSGMTGELALVSAEFGADLSAVVQALRWARWPRVIVLAHTAGIATVIDAVLAGAGGVLRGPCPSQAPAARPIPTMSGREIQIIEAVADGQSNQQIARQLGLSPLTVKSHLARIARKIGTGERAAMVAIAMRAGIIR